MRKTYSSRVILGAAAVLLAGCGLLDTQQPNIIDPGSLGSPEGAASLRLGALADFNFAKDGDGTQSEDGLILVAGLLSDEFELSTTPPSEQEIDQRTTAIINPSLSSIYRNLHHARAGAEAAAEQLQQFVLEPDSTPDIAEMQSIAGFAYTYFGEDFCSGVPFGRVIGDSSVFGQPQTTTQIYETALAKFDSALAHPGLSADDGTITNLATVGRARVLVDLGRFAEAAAAAATVPSDFLYETEHADSPLRLQNAIFIYTTQGLWSVADQEGGVGLPYRSAEDLRVPVDSVDDDGDGFADPGLDLITPQYSLGKYPDATSGISVADGTEARLIEAEGLLQSNNFSGMRAILNDLRDAQGIDPLPTPGNREAAIDQLFSERGFWLFATGHRLGDMRRLIRQYGRDVNTVFPNGVYHKGGTYGNDVNFPLPIEEQNNPNSVGCIDRNA
ncbi:MAG: hypothetical protein ACREL3_02465 [Gemmatimonadales bacterium]